MSALMDPVTQYVFLIGITLVFSIWALNRESITFYLLAAFAWFLCALGGFAIGSPTSPLTTTLAFFFLGVGILFSYGALNETLTYLKEKRGSLELD